MRSALLDRSPQRLAFLQQMRLTMEFIQFGRPHAIGKRPLSGLTRTGRE